VDSWLLRACAKLGIKLIHSQPGRPQGRGKIERFFRTVDQEFCVEIAGRDGEPGRAVNDLAEMNRLFTAWVEQVYHQRKHSETGARPLERWMKGAPYPVPPAEELAELLELDIEEVSSTLGIAARHVSMDTPLSEGEENTLLDVLENPNAERAETNIEHKESLKMEIDRSLRTLTERQKEVICFFFGIGVDHPMSLEDIGDKFNLTRERVRQIKDKAITKLRGNSRSKMLRSYLGV